LVFQQNLCPSTVSRKTYNLEVPTLTFSATVIKLIMNNTSLITTNQGAREELRAALEPAAQACIQPEYEVWPLEDIDQGYKKLLAGKAKGRIVFRVAST
jgi:D-arabinose 1-dehydrogenase-like Zn-dependent alcohol dehydrogenase